MNTAPKGPLKRRRGSPPKIPFPLPIPGELEDFEPDRLETQPAKGAPAEPLVEARTGPVTYAQVKGRARQVLLTALDALEVRVCDPRTSPTQACAILDKLSDFVVAAGVALPASETDDGEGSGSKPR